ncbi:MAG: RpiB/LacA/LacB family sugar-phosphate isomerase [Bacilli bacterium]|nr:RpiB/LacA/LacB family sugar-phosphate isomerase [Bacilli bacterium]MDY6430255.1 RpiB/LacA/LacB family sugar-phosphate isomerase [Bacilli bacterium]
MNLSEVKNLTISLGSDHGGFKYKEAIKEHLLSLGAKVLDEGCYDEQSCDYPIFAKKAANDVSTNKADFGILVCTSGEGISIAANKVSGIRCGIGYNDVVTAKLREHNNANMISFGQAYMKLEDVLRRVDIFLTTSFSTEEKHIRRVKQI